MNSKPIFYSPKLLEVILYPSTKLMEHLNVLSFQVGIVWEELLLMTALDLLLLMPVAQID